MMKMCLDNDLKKKYEVICNGAVFAIPAFFPPELRTDFPMSEIL